MNNITERVLDLYANNTALDKNTLDKPCASILYSSVDTLRKGDFYILGFNPGGAQKDEVSLREQIYNMQTKTTNSYLDEDDWGTRKNKPGEAPFQKRIQCLCEQLLDKNEEDATREICASNLIFFRSKDYGGVDYPNDADTCWHFHEFVINEIIKPSVIITIGNSEERSAYSYLKSKYNISQDSNEPSSHPKFKIKYFATKTLTVIGLPHFSRYSIIKKQGDIALIKRLVAPSLD